MLSPSDFNEAVPQYENGDYAKNPLNPLYIEEPTATNYNRGVEPLQTLPAQWWNWFVNGFTSRFNKLNIYVKNIFNELAQLLSIVDITPDGTESSATTNQLKTMFQTDYPKTYLAKFLHTVASLWTISSDTQVSRIPIADCVTTVDEETEEETTTYETKYVDTLPVELGGTGGTTKQEALDNLTSELTSPEELPLDADIIINNDGTAQKTSIASIVSYAGTVIIGDSCENAAVPVALCTGASMVGKSSDCAFTFNPATGELSTPSLTASLVTATSFCGSLCGTAQNATCFNGCTYACAYAAFRCNVTPYFANNTLYCVGDDVKIGDVNVGGMLGIQSATACNPGIVLRNCDGTVYGCLCSSSGILCWTGGTVKATLFCGTADCACFLRVCKDASVYKCDRIVCCVSSNCYLHCVCLVNCLSYPVIVQCGVSMVYVQCKCACIITNFCSPSCYPTCLQCFYIQLLHA